MVLLWLSSSVWRWSSYAKVSFQRHPEAACATNTQQTWRQEFLGSRSSTVERSSTRTAAAGTFLRFFQTIFENTSLWRLKRLVRLSTYRRYINKCIYLSIYLWTRPFCLECETALPILMRFGIEGILEALCDWEYWLSRSLRCPATGKTLQELLSKDVEFLFLYVTSLWNAHNFFRLLI